MKSQPSLYVFDACSLLNLVASRRFIDIAEGASAKFVVVELAANEVLYVRRGGEGADANEREPVDLRAFERDGYLSIVRLDAPEEIATYVDFATEMDDGEAASCAIAVHRNGTLVTDDRKARRIVGERFPTTSLLTTSELIKAWADGNDLDDGVLARVLLDVEERASFRPSHRDPLHSWWALLAYHGGGQRMRPE